MWLMLLWSQRSHKRWSTQSYAQLGVPAYLCHWVIWFGMESKLGNILAFIVHELYAFFLAWEVVKSDFWTHDIVCDRECVHDNIQMCCRILGSFFKFFKIAQECVIVVRYTLKLKDPHLCSFISRNWNICLDMLSLNLYI